MIKKVKNIKEKNQTLSEREKINYISRWEQRLSYANHKYENEYRLDWLLSLIATGALSVSVKILLDDVSQNNIHFEWFLLVSIFCFSVNLIISLYLFYLGAEAFKFEIERIDKVDVLNEDDPDKKQKESFIIASVNNASVAISKWTKCNLVILSLGLTLWLLFTSFNSDIWQNFRNHHLYHRVLKHKSMDDSKIRTFVEKPEKSKEYSDPVQPRPPLKKG